MTVTRNDEPLPCPFCGGTDLKSGGDDKVVGFWCLTCEAAGPNHYGRHEWNDRAPRSAVDAWESDPHADDIAVDQFAAAMKAKLTKKRAEGRRGWENKDECTAEFLSRLLREHVEKGDPVDVGNIAMMLQQRGERVFQDGYASRHDLIDRIEHDKRIMGIVIKQRDEARDETDRLRKENVELLINADFDRVIAAILADETPVGADDENVALFNRAIDAAKKRVERAPQPNPSTVDARQEPEEFHIIFDGFPSPDGPRFIEVENASGRSINAGEWRKRDDGFCELVIKAGGRANG